MDVAIVGAGYTGLWTAYYLLRAQPSLRVALLEREHVGFGASGRNGGWASAIFPISLQQLAKFSSHAAAPDLQRAMNDTVHEIGRVLAAEGIEADCARQGFVSLARTQAQLARVAPAVRAAAEFGLPGQWRALDAAEAARMVGATSVLGGLFTEHCALVHPGKLVRGLARTVEALGATIYERTPRDRDLTEGGVDAPRPGQGIDRGASNGGLHLRAARPEAIGHSALLARARHRAAAEVHANGARPRPPPGLQRHAPLAGRCAK